MHLVKFSLAGKSTAAVCHVSQTGALGQGSPLQWGVMQQHVFCYAVIVSTAALPPSPPLQTVSAIPFLTPNPCAFITDICQMHHIRCKHQLFQPGVKKSVINVAVVDVFWCKKP